MNLERSTRNAWRRTSEDASSLIPTVATYLPCTRFFQNWPIFRNIGETLAPQLFKGSGSFGNGAAMRVAPIGAFFADDLDTLIKQAELSAMITHSHPEGIAGAIAVALATALAWRHKSSAVSPADFLQQICERVPMSEVHLRIAKAVALLENTIVEQAASALGSAAPGECSRHSSILSLGSCIASESLRRSSVGDRQWIGRPRHNLRDCRWNRCHVSRPRIDSTVVDQSARTDPALV